MGLCTCAARLAPSPSGGGWGWGHRALDSCIAVDSSPEPGIRPGGRVTFFVSPKKVTKERRPHCACPSASLRATCGARVAGPPQNSLRSLRSLRSDSCGESDDEHACPSAGVWPATLRSSARAEGVGDSLRFARQKAKTRFNAPWRVLVWGPEKWTRSATLTATNRAQQAVVDWSALSPPSEAKARPVSPSPLCVPRTGAFRGSGPRMFERSEFARTPRKASTAGCP